MKVGFEVNTLAQNLNINCQVVCLLQPQKLSWLNGLQI